MSISPLHPAQGQLRRKVASGMKLSVASSHLTDYAKRAHSCFIPISGGVSLAKRSIYPINSMRKTFTIGGLSATTYGAKGNLNRLKGNPKLGWCHVGATF